MNAREIQQQIESNINLSIDSLETLHRSASSAAFEQIQNIAPLASMSQTVRPIYENAVASLFDISRTLNRNGGDIARAALDRVGM